MESSRQSEAVEEGAPETGEPLTERQGAILALVQEQGFATIEGLASRFDVSAQTVRRDLIRLDELRLLQRFHGGAGLRGDAGATAAVRLGYTQKQAVSPEAKERIGRACAGLIRPGASLFLDVGTTAEAVARALREHRGLTIVTPSLAAASILAGSGAGEVIVTGGLVRGPDGSLAGDAAVDAIRRFRLDWAVIACSGFEADEAVAAMDFDVLKVGVKQAMIAQARRSVLVADAGKFARSAIVRVAPLAAFSTLVTDAPPPDAMARRMEREDCRLLIASSTA